MANIIAVLNPKGGAGKTTIALHLARALRDSGSVLLVDSDPQGSARDWSEQGGGDAFPIVGVDRAGALKSTINQLAGLYDWIVLDGAA
ncbi:AAA family ATPase, partial [Enterovibrio nigricans]